MAVFVRIFRLVMLFFNIYDSYKVLKLPSSSSRNGGKPSLRAMSQRKRDMKGCLAVWIVWSCFVTYERFAEAIVSLFVPFYDEFKSLVMLFLIMTRARGAEPIYLHVIRPFLKPYTSTIDQLLDFAHVVGNVALGLAALPFIYVVEWWTRRFGSDLESLDTETENSSPSSPAVRATRRPPLSRATTSKSAKSTNSSASKRDQPTDRQTANGVVHVNGTGQRDICRASPPDEETQDLSVSHDSPTSQVHELSQVDEWRQYPAFPSAYPPTPLTKQAQLVTATLVSTSDTLYPTIPEESAQQGFHRSLLLLHNTLNPNYANGSSDKFDHPGVQPDETEDIMISIMEVDDLDESMDRADEYESEDEFNITLRTPDPPLRIITSLEPPSATSGDGISPLSFLSRSSALTTADNGSSLRTPSSIESVPSTDAPILPATLTGHKRPLHQISSNTSSRPRSSHASKTGPTVRVVRTARSPVRRSVVTSQRRYSRSLQVPARQTTTKRGSTEPANVVLDSNPASDANEQTVPKRLRVSLKPSRPAEATQQTRRLVVRATSPARKTTNLRTTTLRPTNPRSSARLRGNSAVKLATLSDS